MNMLSLKKEIKQWRQEGFQKERELLVACWGGYFKSPNQTLNQTPNGVDIVNLAFGHPANNSHLSLDFLTSVHSEEQIKEWVQELRARNIKVMITIVDEPECRWNKVDLSIFVPSLLKMVQEWNLDGVDISSQTDISPLTRLASCFIDLAKRLRRALPDDRILTYTCHLSKEQQDGQVLKNIVRDIDWINIMPGFEDFESMVNLYQDYQTIMGNRITIGVKAGKDVTDMELVQQLTSWEPPVNPKYKKRKLHKTGIMLWTLNRDNPHFTNQKEWTWTDTILRLLPKKVISF